ncbi:hypothetical protein M405DRAFT_855515 [Rhizopogon salebrosus TDB-379]|nr:hypothetical protein M405DRAFT_855515 [Rhizopogon salebrosus TDB-379]
MSPYIHSPDSVYSDDMYSPHEHYKSKRGSPSNMSKFNSWSAYHHISNLLRPPHHVTSINPKVTILTTQPSLSSDVNTPSSTSSQSIHTPSSPFIHEYPECREDMDFNESEDDSDSDMDDMDGVEEESSPFYGATVPQGMKSTSALEGALGDGSRLSGPWWPQPSSTHILTDRRMSVSAPGYPTSSHRPLPSRAQRRQDSDMYSPRPHHSSSPASSSYPHHNLSYTHDSMNSTTTLFAPTSALYQHSSSSSLADAIPPAFAPGATRHSSMHLPIFQPQPIRPIPPIPLDELASAAEVDDSSLPDEGMDDPRERSLSPLPLLCQPVSDAVRYQLSANSSDGESYDHHHQIAVERSPKAPAVQTHHFIPAYPRNCTGPMHVSQIGARKMTWR